MDDLEARIVATLLSMAREGQSLFTLVHTQVSSRASKAEICEDPPPGRSGSRNLKQSHSGTGPRKWQAAMMKGPSLLRGQ